MSAVSQTFRSYSALSLASISATLAMQLASSVLATAVHPSAAGFTESFSPIGHWPIRSISAAIKVSSSKAVLLVLATVRPQRLNYAGSCQ